MGDQLADWEVPQRILDRLLAKRPVLLALTMFGTPDLTSEDIGSVMSSKTASSNSTINRCASASRDKLSDVENKAFRIPFD